MSTRRCLPWLALYVLLFAGLACNMPGPEDAEGPINLSEATAAPSISVEEFQVTASSPQAPAAGAPLVFQTMGNKTSHAASLNASCQSQEKMRLTIRSDGSAELVSTGPGFVDHINCTASASDESWIVKGSLDQSGQVVIFQSCNSGGFTASGSVAITSGEPLGTVICSYKNGDAAVTLQVGP